MLSIQCALLAILVCARAKKKDVTPSLISEKLEKPDKSEKVRTVKARPGNKEVPCEEKLPNIEGTVAVDGEAFKDEIVLLIDDLYQSGVSVNYVAMLLLEAGARKIFGFSCEKTCSNDDNVSRR